MLILYNVYASSDNAAQSHKSSLLTFVININSSRFTFIYVISSKPPVVYADVRSKAVVLLLLLLIYCLLLLTLFMGVLCLTIVLLFRTLCPSSFAIILMGKRDLVALL